MQTPFGIFNIPYLTKIVKQGSQIGKTTKVRRAARRRTVPSPNTRFLYREDFSPHPPAAKPPGLEKFQLD
jgi:hypothetical protein